MTLIVTTIIRRKTCNLGRKQKNSKRERERERDTESDIPREVGER
jgi:hypothetical protein